MKLRKIREEDRPLLAEWMAADPFHRGIDPDIFYDPKSEGLLFEDEEGPVLFVVLSRAVRAFVQFAPGQTARTRVALPEAFSFVARSSAQNGYKQIIFESISKPLIRFCKKCLGFRESPHEFVASL